MDRARHFSEARNALNANSIAWVKRKYFGQFGSLPFERPLALPPKGECYAAALCGRASAVPLCNTKMVLKLIEPDVPELELRTFECPACQYTEKRIVAADA